MGESRLKKLLDDGDSGTPISRIVRAMSGWGTLSAAEIARRTGLARSTVSVALAELRKSGIVVEAPPGATARSIGRPAAPVMLNPEAGTSVGVHLSLADIRVVVADVSHSVISEQTVPLSRDYGPAQAVAATEAAIARAYADNGLPFSGLLGVGISVSAPVRPDGTVLGASILPTWAGVNLRDAFAPALQRPIHADNESNCAALAEMMWGAAVGHADFVLFKIDLGVGGAIVHGGRILSGVAGGGGEFGHMTLDPDGPLCRCGNRGCLEIYASFNRPLAELSHVHGRPVDMDDAILMAERGDTGALRLIADTAEIAGRGLAMVGTVINPPLIIVGGRMALAGDLLLVPLARAYEKHTLVKATHVPEAQRTRITIGKFPENDALLGAVGLVLTDRSRIG